MIRSYYPKPQTGPSKRRFPCGADPEYLRFIRSLPCCVSGVRAGELIEVPFPGGTTGKVRAIIEAAHVKSRGAGGDDVGNVVPLEMSVHRESHRVGIKTFQRKHGIDLREVAAKLARQYRQAHR